MYVEPCRIEDMGGYGGKGGRNMAVLLECS